MLALAVPAADAGPRVVEPWARATPPGAPTGAVYFTLINPGDEAIRLRGAASPAAARVQLHRSVESGGQARMERQRGGIAVPAGERVVFAPGGYHVMLMGLNERLEPGGRLKLTLSFDDAAPVTVDVPIKPLTHTPE